LPVAFFSHPTAAGLCSPSTSTKRQVLQNGVLRPSELTSAIFNSYDARPRAHPGLWFAWCIPPTNKTQPLETKASMNIGEEVAQGPARGSRMWRRVDKEQYTLARRPSQSHGGPDISNGHWTDGFLFDTIEKGSTVGKLCRLDAGRSSLDETGRPLVGLICSVCRIGMCKKVDLIIRSVKSSLRR
jgi:hypothetical protein